MHRHFFSFSEALNWEIQKRTKMMKAGLITGKKKRKTAQEQENQIESS